MANLTIIETSCNHLYRVTETNDAALTHVWFGVEVKRSGTKFIDKKKASTELVRKAASRLITTTGEA